MPERLIFKVFLDEILLENNTWKYIEQIQQMQLLFILKRNDNNMSSQNHIGFTQSLLNVRETLRLHLYLHAVVILVIFGCCTNVDK